MPRLTYAQRKKLPKKSFALPTKVRPGPQGGKQTAGAYPLTDKAHARAALARVSVFGTPEEKRRVRAAVQKKFPGIRQGKGTRKDKAT